MNLFNESGKFASVSVVSDLRWLIDECDKRCLNECSLWQVDLNIIKTYLVFRASEQLHYLPERHLSEYFKNNAKNTTTHSSNEFKPQDITLNFARKLIQAGEYHRAKFILHKMKRETVVEHFLYYFSWYMICLRKKAEFDIEADERRDDLDEELFTELNKEIERFYRKSSESFDCFLLYLLGQIRKDAQLFREATRCLKQAIQADHRCWPAWDCLASLVKDPDLNDLDQRMTEKTWQFNLFTAEAASRLQMVNVAKDYLTGLGQCTFGDSPFMLCSLATARNNLQEHQGAIELFQRVRKIDPYRIDQMNLYSDSLYVREEELELSCLADAFNSTHKFKWETCCILANYYSRRKLHDQSIDFLKRAIRMRPEDGQIWILLGHEYLQTKNQQGAINAYRRAISVDNKSYRAWYGLGQLYEILKLPAYALYYYQQAVRCKPTDSRMLIATGVVFNKLKRIDEAEKCFKKAFQVGDVEGNALTHLATLYKESGRTEQAAKAYEQYLKLYCSEEKDVSYGDDETVADCCKFLANHYFNKKQFDGANEFAQRCLNYNRTKEFGTQLLHSIRVAQTDDGKHPAAVSREENNRTMNTTTSNMSLSPDNSHWDSIDM
ncbi:hypothetical protein M3Y97_00251300 [Aphelenchoides bicaudatus]|nr:hypothetical protein M3Y97_00251300 [Aphelenchoides bicaudatus]